MACKKFVIQKLKKNGVLLRESIIKLLTKYSKQYQVLAEIPDDIIDMVRDDCCWVIHDEKYCLKEIDQLRDDMSQYNQHRKKIIDWFNESNKQKIKKSVA